jgi:hypothetical protein
LKPLLALNTSPVIGALPGMPTVSGCLATSPGLVLEYNVDIPVPLLATQNGPVGDSAMPHGFTRPGSVTTATEGRSETSLVTINALASAAPMDRPIANAAVAASSRGRRPA